MNSTKYKCLHCEHSGDYPGIIEGNSKCEKCGSLFILPEEVPVEHHEKFTVQTLKGIRVYISKSYRQRAFCYIRGEQA